MPCNEAVHLDKKLTNARYSQGHTYIIYNLYMHTVCVHVRVTSTLRVSQNKVFKNECLPWILSKKVPHPILDVFPVYAT